QGERPAMPSPMSPLGAYAAAFQAAYGPAGEQSKPVAASQPAATHQPAVASQPPASAPPPSTGSAGPNIMDVLGDLRGSLENRIDELMWGNQLRSAPQAASLFQVLLGFGFSTALLRALLKRLPEQFSSRAALQWAREE